MTRKELIKFLSVGDPDGRVFLFDGRDIVHVYCGDDVILSPVKPIGYCNRCGDYIYPEEKLDYAGYCPNCDENVFSFEFKEKKEKGA